MRENLSSILSCFSPVSLEEIDNVKLMDRKDIKYTLNFDSLLPVISKIKDSYKILEINGKRVFTYSTVYFDTEEHEMYMKHHNNKLNRYKIRLREYVDTDTKFLEVKFKSNTDRTIKDRIKIKDDMPFKLGAYSFNEKCEKFIRKKTPYKLSELRQKIQTGFSRITLVNQINKERITIDFDIIYKSEGKELGFHNLVIVEVKQEKNSSSDFTRLMHSSYLEPSGISKYCLGIVLFNPEIKYNRFKRNLLILNKLENDFEFPHLSVVSAH